MIVMPLTILFLGVFKSGAGSTYTRLENSQKFMEVVNCIKRFYPSFM